MPAEKRCVVVSEYETRAGQIDEYIDTAVGMHPVAHAIAEEKKLPDALFAIDAEHGLQGPRVPVYIGAREYPQLPRTSRARRSSTPFTNLPASAELNFRAISIASFMMTFAGTSGQ